MYIIVLNLTYYDISNLRNYEYPNTLERENQINVYFNCSSKRRWSNCEVTDSVWRQ